MPFYANTDQLYATMQALFDRIGQQNPAAHDAMLRSRLLIRFQCHDPAGTIVIDARQRPLQTHFGQNSLKPELDIKLATDTLHNIMLGQQSLRAALGAKKLEVRGPVWKTMALADLFRQAQAIYPDLLRELGQTG